MQSSTSFVIPIIGLSEGDYKYSYIVEDDFFVRFEKSPVKSGRFEVEVDLVKKIDHLELMIDFKGVERTACDRCLADINLPVAGIEPLIVKYSDDEREEEEVIFISYNSPSIDLSKYIYEFICLHVPLVKIYDCEDDEDANCNMEVLNKLDNVNDYEELEEETNNPFADSFKNLKL